MTELVLIIPGEAVPFARSGGHGRLRFTPAPQRQFGAVVRDLAASRMQGRPPFDGPISVVARFEYLVPDSWSKKRKAEARYKTSKPDTDNLIKLVKDALNTIVWKDDAQVASLWVTKVYEPLAQTTVVIETLPVGIDHREAA